MAQAEKCIIEIGSDRLGSFSSLIIEQFVGRPDTFELVCWRNALIPASQIDSESLSSLYTKVGSGITFQIQNIQAGTSSKNLFFKGIITEIVSIRSEGSAEGITIKGFSPEILLKDIPKRRSFENKTLKQIAEEVLRPYPVDVVSLSSDIQPRDNNEYPYIVQYDESNYDFLVRLAHTFAEWFYYNGRNLVFGTPSDERIELDHGGNLQQVEVDASISPVKFQTRYYDYLQDRDMEADSGSSDISSYLTNQANTLFSASGSKYPDPGLLNYRNSYALQPDPIDSFFKLSKQKAAFNLYLAGGTGSEPLMIGNDIQIHARSRSESNKDDLGEFLVYSAKHTLKQDLTYTNEFSSFPKQLQIGATDAPHDRKKPYPERGVVTDNNDPDQLGRVRIRLDWQDNSQMTPWARVLSLHSGDSRGSYFIPETGDEVLVDYEDGDPQRPVILGSFYNKSHAPEDSWVTSNNDIKKIRTRSGHTIEFNDSSGSENLIIYNGSGSSPDSNDNKIVLSLNPDKITIESQGDIEIKGNNIKLDAQGNLDLHAATGLTAKADAGSVSVEGTQVTVKGDATAEISSSGSTTVKGSIVQIN